MPSDIVLFGGDILGEGGTCKKPLIIKVSGEEVKRQRKNKSREEALLGKLVVFWGKFPSHYTLFLGKHPHNEFLLTIRWVYRPENHCFRKQVTKTDAVIILKTSQKRLKY